MHRVARTAAAAEVWQLACMRRRAALVPVRTALKRERWTQKALVDELKRGPRLSVNRYTLNNYLNGYARIPERVLWAICQIAGMSDRDLLAQDDNATLLIQPARRKPRK